MQASGEPRSGRVIGRYVLHGEIAAGGMATVHLGRLLGPAGFSRTVAIKRLHPQFAKDPEFVSMFLDEARLAARVRHPNVVSVLDVVAKEGELFLVMDYIQGESLSRLLRNVNARQEEIPPAVAVGIISGALRGLHSAHEATSEQGVPLGIVHRDVSPHNVLVGVDGVPSVVDFGIAKASNRFQTTREGQLKGKLGYMSPEQIRLERIDRRTDVYAASVVLWECLTGRRLFAGDEAAGVLAIILDGRVPAPSAIRTNLPRQLDAVVLRGLAPQPPDRYATAKEMAVALEDALQAASPAKIGEWVERTAGDTLRQRQRQVAAVESSSSPHLEHELPPGFREAPTLSDSRIEPGGLTTAEHRRTLKSLDDATVVEGTRPSSTGMTSTTNARAPHQKRVLAAFAVGTAVATAIVSAMFQWPRGSGAAATGPVQEPAQLPANPATSDEPAASAASSASLAASASPSLAPPPPPPPRRQRSSSNPRSKSRDAGVGFDDLTRR